MSYSAQVTQFYQQQQQQQQSKKLPTAQQRLKKLEKAEHAMRDRLHCSQQAWEARKTYREALFQCRLNWNANWFQETCVGLIRDYVRGCKALTGVRLGSIRSKSRRA